MDNMPGAYCSDEEYWSPGYQSDGKDNGSDDDNGTSVDWSCMSYLQPTWFIQRAVWETSLELDYEDVAFSGPRIHTSLLCPTTPESEMCRGLQTSDCRKLSGAITEYRFIWTQPDANEEAQIDARLKGRCWLSFSREGREWTVRLSLGLDPSSDPREARELCLLFQVGRKTGSREMYYNTNVALSITSDSDWDSFAANHLKKELDDGEDLDQDAGSHSGHATDMDEESDA